MARSNPVAQCCVGSNSAAAAKQAQHASRACPPPCLCAYHASCQRTYLPAAGPYLTSALLSHSFLLQFISRLELNYSPEDLVYCGYIVPNDPTFFTLSEHLYVAQSQTTNCPVHRFAIGDLMQGGLDGATLTDLGCWAVDKRWPTCLVCAPGQQLVACDMDFRLSWYDRHARMGSATPLRSLKTPEQPYVAAFDRNGNILHAGSDSWVRLWASNGTELSVWANVDRPNGLSRDYWGSGLFLTSPNTIIKFRAFLDNGTKWWQVKPPTGFTPYATVLDPRGHLLVSDANGVGGIALFDPATGSPLGPSFAHSSTGTWEPWQLEQPVSLAVGPDGTLFVSDHAHGRPGRITSWQLRRVGASGGREGEHAERKREVQGRQEGRWKQLADWSGGLVMVVAGPCSGAGWRAKEGGSDSPRGQAVPRQGAPWAPMLPATQSA